MIIAVCLKHVVTREWHLRINESRTWVRDEDATFEMNEPDAYALEEALRLKEKHGGEVIAVSAGPARVAHVLRDALARGADRALHISGEHLAMADARTTATALSDALRDQNVDLVLTGLQSDDQGYGQVGVVLAEVLQVPHASLVVAVEVEGNALRVKRELEGGWFQWVALPLPALITVQSGINQLRYASLKGIMAAKKKEIRTVTAAPASAAGTHVVSMSVPVKAKRTQVIAGAPAEAARELVRVLRETRNIE
jgi:electron transfer flavoprotein beta subunit